MSRPLRILVARAGGEAHDRGAETSARALRDAGLEVIYTGLHQTPAMIAETAMQEDVDAISVWVESNDHMTFFKALMEQRRRRTIDHVVIFAQGDVPSADSETLKDLGVVEIFNCGAQSAYIVDWVHSHVRPRA